MQLIGGLCGDQTFSMYIDSKSNSLVGTVRVDCLAQGHSAITPSGLGARTLHPESST